MPNDRTKDFPWQDYAIQIQSPCGRVFSIPMEKVRQDYGEFRSQEDGVLTPEEALEGVNMSDVRSWFMTQFTWDDVDRLGVCEREASDEDIRAALDVVRQRNHPQNRAAVMLREDWIANRAHDEMERTLPPAPFGPKGPSGRI